MRERLGWIRQTDTDSCGPLSTAATAMVIQGMKPSIVSLGSNKLTSEQLVDLRSRLLLISLLALPDRQDLLAMH